MEFLYLLIGFVFGIFGASLVVFTWFQYVKVRHTSDEIYYVRTADSAKITLYRYLTTQPKKGPPVILCHGLMANHFSFDIGQRPGSFARWLKAQGYDVWVLELRGRDTLAPGPFNAEDYNWSFADYAKFDAPAAIDFVLERSRQKQVIWIGHSMGGMVGYHLGTTGYAEKIQSMVTIGSPVDFKPLGWLKSVAKWFIRFYHFPMLPAGFFVKLFAPILAIYNLDRFNIIANASNFSYREKLIILGNVLNNLSSMVMREFAVAVKYGYFRSKDGTINFGKDFQHFRLPVLFVAGGADGLVPPDSIRTGYEECQSPVKRYVLFSKTSGFSADLGHGDLILSHTAEDELYPLVRDFMEEMKKTAPTLPKAINNHAADTENENNFFNWLTRLIGQ